MLLNNKKMLLLTSIFLGLVACASKSVERAADFSQADRNRDGKVSQAEWLNTGGSEAAFLAIDKERKGKLDETQFRDATRLSDQSAMNVQRQQQMADEDINSRVREALTSQRSLNPAAIRVETYQRQVTLSGSVRTMQEKNIAEDTARGVSGVSNVFNQLVIRQ